MRYFLVFLAGFSVGCVVASAAALGYWYYRRANEQPPPIFLQSSCSADRSSAYPLPYSEIAQTAEYAPPTEFDHRVTVLGHEGCYCVGWRGACRWFAYPPVAAVQQGELLAVTLCLGGQERVTYLVRAEGGSLVFAD
jgi:hypothetical protein